MSISFTAMQNALLANGMYEITEDTRLYAELKAYDAGFQTLHDQLDELLQEALIPTAVSYVLEEKELLFGLHLSSCTEEERRKLLCMRGAVNVNSFSKADFLNILQSGGIEAEVTESPSTQHIGVQVLSVKDGQTQQDTQKAVSDYIPAHVECTVTFASEAE